MHTSSSPWRDDLEAAHRRVEQLTLEMQSLAMHASRAARAERLKKANAPSSPSVIKPVIVTTVVVVLLMSVPVLAVSEAAGYNQQLMFEAQRKELEARTPAQHAFAASTREILEREPTSDEIEEAKRWSSQNTHFMRTNLARKTETKLLIESSYRSVLNRGPTDAELLLWRSALADGLTMAGVREGIPRLEEARR